MPPMRDMRPLDHSIKIGPALGKTFRYMKKYLPFIVFAMVCAAGATVLSVVGPRLLGHMTDIMKDGLISGIDMAAIARMGFFLLAVYLGSAALSMLQQYMMAAATLRISKQMRGDLDTKINRVPMVYFSRNTQGDILSRITNDVSTVQQGLANSLPGMLSSLVQFVGCLVMMLVIEIRMAGALILLTFLGFALVFLFPVGNCRAKHLLDVFTGCLYAELQSAQCPIDFHAANQVNHVSHLAGGRRHIPQLCEALRFASLFSSFSS